MTARARVKIFDRPFYDALVVGGGPAGATAAILLATTGWRVGLVERKPFPRRKVCGEFVSATSWQLLHDLGITAPLLAQAGPEVRQVGLYSGETVLAAEMPRHRDGPEAWGRALGRELLDSLLLARAAEAGADVIQPWALLRVQATAGGYLCSATATGRERGAGRPPVIDLRARLLIAAHGSWEPGSLPTQRPRVPPRASDLLAFKAHFRDGRLPSGLMPLLTFPGGYGGMVQTDGGRLTLSCCIRRDTLERCRRESGNARAGDAVLEHVQTSCRGVRKALHGARLDGPWLSAGPIRPGIRPFRRDRIFVVGNAVGEAHPIVAEGISMAIQSAWLLCASLAPRRDAALSADASAALETIGRDYEIGWRRNFAARVHAAALFAAVATRPPTARLARALLRRVPTLLTLGAQWSGKTRPLRVRRGGQELIVSKVLQMRGTTRA